eukprot:s25_g26.t1
MKPCHRENEGALWLEAVPSLLPCRASAVDSFRSCDLSGIAWSLRIHAVLLGIMGMWGLMLMVFGALKTSQGVTLTILNEVFDGTTGFSISAAFFTDGSDDFFGILNQDGETGLFSGGPGVVPASAFPGTQTGVVGSDFQVSGFDNAYLVA